jgi:hypothetical protein
MPKRYYIELSRKDVALVSYFPPVRSKDNKWGEWIEEVLIPAVKPIADRKSAKIRETPITFWISIQKTSRRSKEIFLFMTPANPRKVIEKAFAEALQPIKGGNVHTSREPIPENAVPCLQIFRGKLIRFYMCPSISNLYFRPMVFWRHITREIELWSLSYDDDIINIPVEESDIPLVEARILDKCILSGKDCRKIQQAQILMAREVK